MIVKRSGVRTVRGVPTEFGSLLRDVGPGVVMEYDDSAALRAFQTSDNGRRCGPREENRKEKPRILIFLRDVVEVQCVHDLHVTCGGQLMNKSVFYPL